MRSEILAKNNDITYIQVSLRRFANTDPKIIWNAARRSESLSR